MYLNLTSLCLSPLQSLQFVTRAATTMRASLKEPAKTKAMANESFSYNAGIWKEGKSQGKTPVSDLGAAGL